MPSSLHPQAKFDPIPPDLDLHALVENTPNFEWAAHISASEIYALGQQRFEKLVSIHVINGGKPLVIKNWHDRLPKDLFSATWLEETYNKKEERVWDINNKTNIPMTMGHYLRSMKQLTNQWNPRNFRDERRQRLYLKDIDCPPEWHERLKKILPRSIFYLNEDVEGRGNKHHYSDSQYDDDEDMFVDDHPVARAGDLMSSLPSDMRAENLMCYIGHEGTYTPAHREMCASLGQNIMVETSGSENGEKPGSSIWFMTETKDREVIGEYFLSMLGHDVEIEKHFAQINAWKKATFPVYIVEQKVGDLILVPPLAPHQVWNRGTRTMKVAWNRTTAETLGLALHEALPKARLVCRDEQYKNKAIIYYTLDKYYKELEFARSDGQLVSFGISQDMLRNPARTTQVADDFKKLLQLFTEILVDEMFGTKEKNVEYIPFDSNITCSYCRANIFNRFLTCKHCCRPLIDGSEDTYDICMECYAMGRSCMCVSGLDWCEQWSWEELVRNYERWQAMVVSNDGFIDAFTSPPPPEVAKLRAGKIPVAQICQEQLRRRPFRDITKPAEPEVLEPSDPEVDEDGKVAKKKSKRKQKKGDTYRCHVCCHKDYRYRLAFCSTPGCQEAYCYGVLYRGFDMMPQSVMQQEYWKCPRCMKICNCGSCRRSGITTPYLPKSTLLGHDTRPIADDRSVELLINFRLHNLLWLRNSGEESRSMVSKRMQRLRLEADAAKAQHRDRSMDDIDGISSSLESIRSSQRETPTNNGGNGAGSAENPHLAHTNNYAPGTATASGIMGDHSTGFPGEGVTLDPALLQNGPPSSYLEPTSYPDPSLAHDEMSAMFGRAYYMDDDDSADKILFDPYQEPAPNPIMGALASRETLPEFLESYPHKAVRRPRHEKDDDPDYEGPRSHHRKKPRTAPEGGHQDASMNLDPALLSASSLPTPAPPPAPAQDTSTTDAAAATETAVGSSVIRFSTARAGGSTGGVNDAPFAPMVATDDDSTMQIDHDESVAGGTADTEPEEVADDEPAYGYPANTPELRHARAKVSYRVDAESGDEADNGSGDKDSTDAATAHAEQQKEKATKPAALNLSTKTAPATGVHAPGVAASPTPKRGPGRPRKSDAGMGALSGTFSSGGSSNKAAVATSLVDPRQKRGPGRPRKSLVTAPTDSDEDSAEQVEKPKQRPGRPAKNRPSESPAAESPSLLPPPSTQFMSMAERLALRGKKFKIGRKTQRSSSGNEEGGLSELKLLTTAAPRAAGEVISVAIELSSPTAVVSSPASLSRTVSKEPEETEGSPRGSLPAQRGRPTIGRGRAARASTSFRRQASTPSEVSDFNGSESESDERTAPVKAPPRSTGLRGRGRPAGTAAPVRASRGPTVVRLAGSDGSGDDGSGNVEDASSGSEYQDQRAGGRRRASDHEDSSDDSDISATAPSEKKKTYFARRGGARGRGRGRGGRPVGVGRHI